MGLTLADLEPLPAQLSPGTMVVLTGISAARIDPQEPAARRVIEWLRATAGRPELLLCVCAGSVLGAHAGLLAGRELHHPP